MYVSRSVEYVGKCEKREQKHKEIVEYGVDHAHQQSGKKTQKGKGTKEVSYNGKGCENQKLDEGFYQKGEGK